MRLSAALTLTLTVAVWLQPAGPVPRAQAGLQRIAANPYADTDWQHDIRLKAQFHDHVKTEPARILAYDQAGYDVVSLMHYSGSAWLENSWKERRWPPADWLSPDLLDNLQNIRFFISNAEEVGPQHFLSPFLTEYIEYLPPGSAGEKQPYQYSSVNEGMELIRSLGGLPFLAHPIDCCRSVSGYHAVEIYQRLTPHTSSF